MPNKLINWTYYGCHHFCKKKAAKITPTYTPVIKALNCKIKYRVNMDGFTFTTELIKALAWPSSVIILVFLLRKPIIELVPLMKKLKFKELEMEFSQEVKALKSEVKETSGVGTPTITVSEPTNSKALDLLSSQQGLQL
jgi:hypothetical protein